MELEFDDEEDIEVGETVEVSVISFKVCLKFQRK